jgi:cellulose synthase/poly-beta-1,6-N-acetylglucosamine synthase-like glycosyltransferase
MDWVKSWFRTNPLYGTFGNVLFITNTIMTIVLFLIYFYQNIYAIVAIFPFKKKYPEAKKNHKYAYIICAHDEEAVVGNLVDSIFKQNYPKELMTVFVCADNCKDNTAKVAREAGAIVYERQSSIKGKSYALNFTLHKIFEEYDNEGFEAVFVFDADNLVSKNYTYEMNKTYDQGYLVSTSFRNSKNFDKNWVSAGASMLFLRECICIHHSRRILNIGTYVSGTGFYVDYKLLRDKGWDYHLMTEDIEFSIDCAMNGIFIAFNEDAEFYDEQPETLKDSLNQRLRWCKGTNQCFYKYFMKGFFKYLFKKISFIRFELTIHVSPIPLISFLWTLFYLVATGINTAIRGLAWYNYYDTFVYSIAMFLLSIYGMALIHALIVTFKYHKNIDCSLFRQILYCFTFPIYAAFFLPLLFVALFKPVSWKKVPHTISKKIEDMK